LRTGFAAGPEFEAMDPKYAQYNYSVATEVPEQQTMDNNNMQAPTVVGVAVNPYSQPTQKVPTHKINMGLDDDAIHGGLPPELRAAGMTEATWGAIVRAVEDGKRENPFHNCKICECIYFCVPGGPLQTALCLILNPCTWCIVAKTNQGIRSAAASVGGHLQQNNAQWDCKEEHNCCSDYIVIYPRGGDA
jgi:hypothetical protein